MCAGEVSEKIKRTQAANDNQESSMTKGLRQGYWGGNKDPFTYRWLLSSRRRCRPLREAWRLEGVRATACRWGLPTKFDPQVFLVW